MTARKRLVWRPLRWSLPLLLIGLLGLSGCIQPIQRPLSTPAPPLDLAQSSTNRLLVLGSDGNIFTINPDGANRYDLTADASASHFYAQPTWSPSGERIAWAEINSSPGEVTGALLTSAADGSARMRIDAVFPPFFIYWSPNSEQLVYLSNWLSAGAQTIALQLVDVAAGGADLTTLGVGQPFYVSWAPDGSQLLTHVGGARIGLLGLDGAETILAEASASFATPQWSNDGEHLLYGIQNEETPQLVVANRRGEVQQVVTFFQDAVRTAFGLSPSGRWVAYTETEAPLSVNSFGPLYLFERETGALKQLSPDPVVAFFWSPSGDRLLFLRAELVGEQIWFRPQVWDEAGTRQWDRFAPSGIFFNQYLPFADQYAQNLRFWSPAGDAFVYAGAGEDGRQGIWVQPLRDEEPTFVTEGLLATWSPQ